MGHKTTRTQRGVVAQIKCETNHPPEFSVFTTISDPHLPKVPSISKDGAEMGQPQHPSNTSKLALLTSKPAVLQIALAIPVHSIQPHGMYIED